MRRAAQIVPWLLFFGWLLLAIFSIIRSSSTGLALIDFATYQTAARSIDQGDSPYPTLARSRAIWQSIHQLELNQISGQSAAATPRIQGPYLYPPTLALLIAQLRIGPELFIGLLAIAIGGFAWLWLASTGRSGWWLLLIAGSWDVQASFLGGNIELILLGSALAGAWLLWHKQALWAAPLSAFTILCKPFYGLLFVAISLLMVARAPGQWRVTLRAQAGGVAVTLLLIGLEVLRWGSALRAAAVAYLRNAPDSLWFTLPIAEQTPMSIWNRAPVQGLILLGKAPEPAQGIVFAGWLMLLLITVWWVWGRPLSFAMAFALALVLLYAVRPVGWGLIYLEVVVVLAAWPDLGRGGRLALLGAALALLASHWWALILTAQGRWVRLFTLQSATFPWETWLVIPLCWLLLISLSRRLATRDVPRDEMVGELQAPQARPQ